MPYAHDEKRLQNWEKDRLHAVAKNPLAWCLHDLTIVNTVADYRKFLGSVPVTDWRQIKAMAWVESGPGFPEDWRDNPLQIAKFDDPGFDDLLQRGRWILPPDYAATLTKTGVRSSAVMSTRAAIGYLFLLLAHTKVDRTSHAKSLARWTPFSFEFVARKYNWGDGNYAAKLHFCYALIVGTRFAMPDAQVQHD